jgi:colanic acid/amylovoran biosynthesis glycosyltransferase
MLTIAYLANLFPSPVEPYVVDEIEELRSRGVRVIAASVRRPGPSAAIAPDIVLQSISPLVLVQALWLCLRKWPSISDLIGRTVLGGSEGPWQRLKTLLHTWLGACYAISLQKQRVDHIHAHHGYFGSWVAMIAARLLDIGYSFTLHGSDLLMRAAYLDAKLRSCSFCLTISEFNRRYILEQYPSVVPEKILVSRLGVEVPASGSGPEYPGGPDAGRLRLLAVGRLQAVKNHAFLIRGCAELARRGVDFECAIAGGGPERRKLAKLIRKCGLTGKVKLLGQVPRQRMDACYRRADIVVLTSHSEGIPLVLMEAMARRRIVLAPEITGIPELVIPGKTGFLYKAGSLVSFIERLSFIHLLLQAQRQVHSCSLSSAAKELDWIRHAAHMQVRHNFNRRNNLKSFADLFLTRIVLPTEALPHANLVLQQI